MTELAACGRFHIHGMRMCGEMIPPVIKTSFARFIQLATLSALGVADPLLQILSEGPEFFVARDAPRRDVVYVILAAIAALPIFFTLISTAFSVVNKRLGSSVHGLGIVLLATIHLIPILHGTCSLSGVVSIAVALVAATFIAVCLARYSTARLFLYLLSPGIVAVPIMFIMSPGIHTFLFPEKVEFGSGEGASATPVALLIFDEFALNALLDKNLQIDESRFPNFAALAKEATWFRNATAVNQFTPFAVPPILSGRFPDPNKLLPTISNFPGSIFTMLRGSHEITAYEPITRLCPAEICKRKKQEITSRERIETLFSDLSAVILNVLLPKDLGVELPDITGQWADFWGNAGAGWHRQYFSRARRVIEFLGYVDRMKKGSKPPLFFFHSILPHMPFQYYPSGRLYTPKESLRAYGGNKWTFDPDALSRSYQRYLMQIGAVDTLLGKFIAKLKSLGIYDDTLLVVTADHGLSFTSGTYRRGEASQENFYRDVMSVPLFIKKPKQTVGEIREENAEAIDVLPTIASLLGVAPWWKVDGQPLLKPNFTPRAEKRVLVGYEPTEVVRNEEKEVEASPKHPRSFPVPTEFPRATIDWKFSLPGFASPNPDYRFFIGPHNELLGKSASDFGTVNASGATVELMRIKSVKKDGKRYLRYRARSGSVPGFVMGKIRVKAPPAEKMLIAATMAGTIQDVVTAIPSSQTELIFETVLGEKSFMEGMRPIQFYVVREQKDGSVKLEELPFRE